MVTSSAFAKHPDYKLTLDQYQGLIEVWFHGVKIASTQKAIEMREAEYSPVYYIPFDDCVAACFHKTAHTTYCPFKGSASYWSLAADGEQLDNCVWGYEEPFDEVTPIAGHVAFYSDKVDIRFP